MRVILIFPADVRQGLQEGDHGVEDGGCEKRVVVTCDITFRLGVRE